MADNDAPRFGQRSENWTPDGNNAGSNAGTGESAGTPWPQYGHLDESAKSPQPTWGQYGGQAPNQAGHQPAEANQSANGQTDANPAQASSNGNQGSYQQSSWQSQTNPTNPYATSVPGQPPAGAQPGYGAQTPYGGQPGGPALQQPLPSRAWPIVLIVVGAVMALIVSWVVMFAVSLSSINLEDLADATGSVSSGSSITVDDSGSVMLLALDQQSIQCFLTDKDGQQTPVQSVGTNDRLVFADDLTPGTYMLSCDPDHKFMLLGDDDPEEVLAHAPTEAVDNLTGSFASGLVWGTVVGVGGIIMFVVGLVWLIRVNRRRREIQAAAFHQPRP